jgi:hypothetical protein
LQRSDNGVNEFGRIVSRHRYKIRTKLRRLPSKLLKPKVGSPRIRFSNFFSQHSLMFLGPEMDSNCPRHLGAGGLKNQFSRPTYSRYDEEFGIVCFPQPSRVSAVEIIDFWSARLCQAEQMQAVPSLRIRPTDTWYVFNPSFERRDALFPNGSSDVVWVNGSRARSFARSRRRSR